MTGSYSLDKQPTATDINIVSKGLDDFNSMIVEPDNHEPMNIVVKDDQGNVIGGILGGTYWKWLHIERFWIAEAYRGQGLGKKLLGEMEKEAVEKGCRNVHVETHDFQALRFYLKNGYKRKMRLKDLPEGHSKYFLVKRLSVR